MGQFQSLISFYERLFVTWGCKVKNDEKENSVDCDFYAWSVQDFPESLATTGYSTLVG